MTFNLDSGRLGVDTLGLVQEVKKDYGMTANETRHDFKKFPELTDAQMQELFWESPHKQITESFKAEVVKVHDGDTITVKTTFRDFEFPIRFGRIDTKELSEGGVKAGDYMREQVEGEMVEILIDKDNRVGRYGRLIGEVVYKGINMNDEMVRLGLATPFGQRGEGKLLNMDKELNIKQWL